MKSLELLQPAPPDPPCTDYGPDLFFSESPRLVETAKLACRPCPLKLECLAGAVQREEPWGVWGGEVFVDGRPVPYKRPRGRPRKHPVMPAPLALEEMLDEAKAS